MTAPDTSSTGSTASTGSLASDQPKAALPVRKDELSPGKRIDDTGDASFPSGTVVVEHSNGTELVANIPAKDGEPGYFRVTVPKASGIHALAAAAEKFEEPSADALKAQAGEPEKSE